MFIWKTMKCKIAFYAYIKNYENETVKYKRKKYKIAFYVYMKNYEM